MKIHTWIKAGVGTAMSVALAAMLSMGAHAAEGLNEGATYVGQEVCGTCHTQEDNHFNNTIHAKAFANPKTSLEAKVCEACHGPGSKHAADAGNRNALIGFSREWGTSIDVQKGQCLQCHKGGQRQNWAGSIHDRNKLSCSDCHNPMAKFSQSGLMKRKSITETCITCHQEKRAEFSRRSHMPVLEGKMSCDDCHNPHGSPTKRLLKGDSVAETCFQCHAEKRGPFLWEHPPVRQGDQCLNCHLPHGSNQEKLLVQARPMLCIFCHNPGAPHDAVTAAAAAMPAGSQILSGAAVTGTAQDNRFAVRSCQNCHMEIHGSNSPAGARWHR